MPRVSLKHEDAMMGGGVQEGYFEVTKCVCAVHQFPPNSKTGVQSDPFTAIRFTLNKLNEDWSELDEAESVTLPIRLGKLDSIRPGSLKNPDDLEEDPKDLGSEVDTEGNSVYGEDGAKASGNWGAFEQSLRAKGFRADVIARQYMPDYVGMKFHLKTVDAGTYKDKNTQEEKKATNLVVDQIHTYPWDVKKSKSKSGSVKASAKAESNGSDSEAALDIAKAVLGDLSDVFKKAVKPGQSVKRSTFQIQFQLELTRKKIEKAMVGPVLTAIKNDENLAKLAEECEFVFDPEEGTVIFPE